MNLNDLLPDGGIEALAAQLGIPREQAQRGAEALLPAVLGGMGNNAAQLDTRVNALGGADLASNVLGNEPTHIDHGNQILAVSLDLRTAAVRSPITLRKAADWRLSF